MTDFDYHKEIENIKVKREIVEKSRKRIEDFGVEGGVLFLCRVCCGVRVNEALTCSKCGIVKYCSQECKKTESFSHPPECTEICHHKSEDIFHFASMETSRILTQSGFQRQSAMDFNGALSLYTRAIEYNQQVLGPFFRRSLLLLEFGRMKESLQDINSAIEIFRKENVNLVPVELLTNRGRIYNTIGFYEGGVKDFTTVLSQTQKGNFLRCAPLLDRARSYSLMHEYPNALKDLEEALSFAPFNPLALLQRGQLFAKIGYLVKNEEVEDSNVDASKFFELSLKNFTGSLQKQNPMFMNGPGMNLYCYIGEMHELLGHKEQEAMKYYDLSIQNIPYAVLGYMKKSSLLMTMGKTDESIEMVLQKAYNIDMFCMKLANDNLKKNKRLGLALVSKNGLVLQHLDTDSLGRDKEIVRAAVRQNVESLKFAHDSLKGHEDKEFVKEIVLKNTYILPHVGEALRRDREFILDLVSVNGYVLEHIDETLKNDAEIVGKALSTSGKFVLSYCGHQLKEDRDGVLKLSAVELSVLEDEGFKKWTKDRDFMLSLIELRPATQNGFMWNAGGFGLIDDSLKKDVPFLKEVVKRCWECLFFFDDKMKDLKELVMDACKEDGKSLSCASIRLRGDRDVLIEACRHSDTNMAFHKWGRISKLKGDKKFALDLLEATGYSTRILPYFSKKVRGDRHIIITASKRNREHLLDASKSLKLDPKFALEAISEGLLDVVKRLSFLGGEPEFLREMDYEERDVWMEKAVGINGLVLEHLSNSWKNSKMIVEKAVRQNGMALEFAGDEIRNNDREVVDAAVSQNGLALQYTSELLKNDKNIVTSAVSNEGMALKFCDTGLLREKEVVLAAVKQNGMALELVDERLTKDREICFAALNQNPEAYEFVHPDLQKLEEILTLAGKSLKPGEEKSIDTDGIFDEEPNFDVISHTQIQSDKVLGSGAFGVVRKGVWEVRRNLQISVAVKEITMKDESKKDEILREYESQYALKHPNVLEVYGYTTPRPLQIGIIMELMDSDLYKYVTEIKLSIAQKIDLMEKMVESVLFLHRQNPVVIHRDIKPHNFLVTSDGKEVKLSDFGLIKVPESDNESNHEQMNEEDQGSFIEGGICGTPNYMSPESFSEDEGKYSIYSDIYALGISFWEVLYEKHAYEGMPTMAVLYQVSEMNLRPRFNDPPLPLALKPLEFLIRRMWYKVPEIRPDGSFLKKWFEDRKSKFKRLDKTFFP